MAVDIRELTELDDLHALAELFGAVWGRAGEPPISSDILKAFALSGNYLSGAYVKGRMVGGLVGWLAGAPDRHLHMHSHILGVLPGSDAHGLGFELKQHQRRWCIARSIKVIEWTTDPLVRRNAYFNLSKLGARAPRYLVNLYGEMKDGINAGEQSDRLLIRWQLDSPAAEAAAMRKSLEPDVDTLRSWGTPEILSVGASGEPVIAPSSARVLLCQVPADIVAIRRAYPPLSREWRLALRGALGAALGTGYEIIGATRSGWYVLEKQ